jgi:ATP-dependent RNA helicase DeaD
MELFKSLGLSPDSLAAIEKKGFEEPTAIQARIIPLLLKEKTDIIAQAQTGTGKTAAFGLVFVETIKERKDTPQAIVLTPTRELALQVAEEINSLQSGRLRIAAVYGGQSIGQQLKQLKNGVDIVIGTPGRILDHLRRKSLVLNQIRYAVLDEADEMLNMGFIEDIETILKETNEDRQLLLFSATMPDRIMKLAKKFMKNHQLVQTRKEQLATSLVDQIYFEVKSAEKFEALCRIIDIEEDFYGIVFCRTKVDTEELARKLKSRAYQAEALNGDIPQNLREKILDQFRTKITMILIATDVAARGIDVNNLTHVINYSLPQDPESYVHRIGRTGRAGNEGTAITFVTRQEYRELQLIQKMTKSAIRKEKIPKVDEIIEVRKERIETEIRENLDGDLELYRSLASSLTRDMDPSDVLASLLKIHYSGALDPSSYASISENMKEYEPGPDAEGATRLFITLGHKDEMTRKKLALLIEKSTGVPESIIRQIEIYELFSFVTVPFEEAEIILKQFKHHRKNGPKVIVQKADTKKDNKKKKRRRN